MSVEKSSWPMRAELSPTTSARQQLLHSFRDSEYRRLFVAERLRATVALQIRALRQQRQMTQAKLGEAIGMAQTWVSKLEDPDYGKMTVATLLRLAHAFDTDIEIKFRPFTETLNTLPTQGPNYFYVPSFDDEFGMAEADDIHKVQSIAGRLSSPLSTLRPSALNSVPAGLHLSWPGTLSQDVQGTPRKQAGTATSGLPGQESYGASKSTVGQSSLAL